MGPVKNEYLTKLKRKEKELSYRNWLSYFAFLWFCMLNHCHLMNSHFLHCKSHLNVSYNVMTYRFPVIYICIIYWKLMLVPWTDCTNRTVRFYAQGSNSIVQTELWDYMAKEAIRLYKQKCEIPCPRKQFTVCGILSGCFLFPGYLIA